MIVIDVVAFDPRAEVAFGTSFSVWQARTQLPQPMHLEMSINIPHQWSLIL